MVNAKLVSFVIIAYNEADNIGGAIKSITDLDDLEEYEIIVIDDGSRDYTADVVRALSRLNPRIRLIRLERNQGRGYARHIGINEASGNLIATIDADIVLPPHWLTDARSALEGHAAVGGTAIPDGDVAYIYKRFQLVPRLVGHTTAVTGSNALFRREVFSLISFDPNLREGEDVALNHVGETFGLAFTTVPGLIVQHNEHKAFGQSLRWLFQSGKGATRQLLEYRQIRQPDLAFSAFLGSIALAFIAAVKDRPAIAVAIPPGFIVFVSFTHLASRFDIRASPRPRFVSAVGVNGAMLTAYFLGRVAGFTALRTSSKARKGAL